MCIIEEENTQENVQDNMQDRGGAFMGDYRPPFTVTNKILLYVSSISEKTGRITAIGSLTANSLTLGQVRDVISGR